MEEGQYEQSYVLASSTHESTPRPADLQAMAENYEGADLNYNMGYHKVQEMNQIEMMVAAKSFKLLILLLEEWKSVILVLLLIGKLIMRIVWSMYSSTPGIP